MSKLRMELEKYPQFDNIWCVKGFNEEFEKLFGKSMKDRMRYTKKLFASLELLDRHETDNRKEFEKIEENLYSIRYKSKMNPRILYTCAFVDGRYILLTPFLEKDASDYKESKRRARAQLKILLEGDYHE